MPLYKLYLIGKKIINKFYAPQKIKHKLLHPFSRRYLIHISVIFLTLITTAINLNAYEVKQEDIKSKSILSSLAIKQDLGIIEEKSLAVNGKKITRYLGPTAVESKPQTQEGEGIEEMLPQTVTGGSAIVTPYLSPLEAEIRKRDKIVDYIVQLGDTVSGIAEKFGLSVNTVLWENNLTAYSIIRPGDKLAILPISGVRHQVKSGETLQKIAKNYNAEVEKIIEFNKLASADDLKIGERLLIPGGVKPAPKIVYTIRTSWYEPPKVTPGGKMLWPATCRRITQYYNWLHHAIDIGCQYGSSIRAAESGVIIQAQGGWNGGYGVIIIIDHGGGRQTLYTHLSKIYVSVGNKVARGEIIGAMGSTGRSTGSHLHFEVRIGGQRVNPLYYIR